MSAAPDLYLFPTRKPSFDDVIAAAVEDALVKREDGQLLTFGEVQERLRVSPNTLTKLIRDYGLPVVKVGGSKRIRLSALLSFIESNES